MKPPDHCFVTGTPVIGDGTWIGPYTVLDAVGGLNIGCSCSIASGVHIYTHDMGDWQDDGDIERAPVTIGDHVLIGPQAVICKGVTIGDNAMVGAFSFVREDVPAGAKVWGQPAEVQW